MNCGCQVSTAAQTGGVTLPITAIPGRAPLLSPVETGLYRGPQIGMPFAPATAAGQNGALAQNLAQAQAPAPTKKKTSGWLVAALAAGALVFL